MKTIYNALLEYILPLAQFLGLGWFLIHAPELTTFSVVGFGFMFATDALFLTALAFVMVLLTKRTQADEKYNNAFLEGLSNVDIGRLLFAGTEDVLFVGPLLFLNGTSLLLGLALSCILFAVLHADYPLKSRIFKMLYIGLSYWFASQYGLLTVIASHGLKDALCGIAGRILKYYTSDKSIPTHIEEEEAHVSIH